MKASEVIEKLTTLIETYGDLELESTYPPFTLSDVDYESTVEGFSEWFCIF